MVISKVMVVTYYSNFHTVDVITAVEFDETGNYLATGDKGGRVVLFERGDKVFCWRD